MFKQLRYAIRKLLNAAKYRSLQELAQRHLALQTALNEQAKYEIDLLIRPYAHKFMPLNTTLERLETDILTFSPLLGKKGCAEGFTMRLHASPKVISEGLFSLLLEREGCSLYALSISVVQNHLLIACAQGLADVAQMKAATKAAHGLRPINLALFLAASIAQYANLSLAGVREHAQISGFKKRKNDFVNYDELWRANAEILGEFEHFYILDVPRRDPEQIASKKRSEYRRRYALIDEILKEFYEA